MTGRIAPVDPAAPPINFHVNLPTSWNRKLAQMGGSGSNGVIPVALTTGMHWGPESIPPNAPYALSRGFVAYGSDSGHQTAGGRGAPAAAPAADWTTNDEAFTNFAYAQMKKTHDVAVALVARFYGESIRRSYYLGSSQGGREALIVAQRFPQDYDGVFAQVPANTYVHLSIGEPLARAKAQAGDGWIPPAKVAVIGKEVLRQCDALDGIADGLVSNYMACDRRFDPAASANPLAAVRCEGGADTGESCLSDAQIRAANAVHGSTSYPFALANGWTTFSGWPTGSESATNWKALPSRPTAAGNFGVLRSRIVRDPNANLLDVDLAKYAKELQQLSELIDAANPDLSAFRRRGGKLILKVNTTDYTVNPRWIMDYYEKMQKAMGARTVGEFVRFYVAIGLFHNRNVGRNPITNALVPMYVDFIAHARRLGGARQGARGHAGVERDGRGAALHRERDVSDVRLSAVSPLQGHGGSEGRGQLRLHSVGRGSGGRGSGSAGPDPLVRIRWSAVPAPRVLIGGARMPAAAELPNMLRQL